jgi:hypothetical protein
MTAIQFFRRNRSFSVKSHIGEREPVPIAKNDKVERLDRADQKHRMADSRAQKVDAILKVSAETGVAIK